MDDQTNSYSLLDGDDHFLPTFSRLPPDGHEFPPNYLENDFAPPDAGDFLTPEKFRHYEKPLIDPPAAFQDTEALFIGMVQNGVKRDDLSLSRSNVDDHMQDVLDGRGFLDDASTMSSKSSEAGDTVVYEELPPPLPVMKLLSESSLSDGEVSSTDDPVDAEFFHGKSVLDTAYVITDDKPPPLPKSGPPIPPKRTLASKAPLPMERASKTEEHLMSVKDKIAMFTAKTEPSPNPPSPTKPRAAKRASLTIERLPEQEIPKEVVQVEISLIQTEVTPADEDSIPPPIPPSLSSETFESVVEHQSRHRTELVVHSPVPYMVDCYHDRSGSSLSTASSFSKSSDDLLSQDVDSSDVDESTIRAAPSLDHLCPPQSRHTISDLRRKHSSSSSGNQCSDNYKSNWSTSSTDSEVGRLKTKSMYSVLESKKQNVSKLKGLVIPSVAESEKPAVPATPDLPLIFSVDSIRLPKVEPLKHVSSLNDIRPQNNHNRPTQLPAALTANTLDIQKYSPAFKRKPFTLTKSDTEVLEVDKTDETDNSLNGGHLADGEEHLQTSDLKNDQPFSINSDWLSSAPPPLPTSLPPKVSMRSLHSHHGDSSTYADDLETTSDLDELQDIEDQESGISSIESPNVSIHNTPPGSPKEMHHSKQKMRSLDAGVLANGLDVGPHFVSQIKTPSSASSSWDPHSPLSDSDSVMDPRILKPNSVEAINRKNVLQSSRHSSGGFDDDYSRLSTSNVPETSFDRKSSLSSLSPPTSLEFKENSFKRYHSLDDKGTRHQEKKSPEKVDKKEGLLHSEAKRSSDISRESKSSLYSEGAKTVSDERWQELSRKYGSKNSSSCDKGQFRRSEVDVLDNKGENVASLPLSNKTSATDKKAPNPKHFKALAEKWEQITVEPNGSLPLKNMKSSASLSKSMPSIAQNGSSKTSFANILQDTIHTYGVKAQDSKEEKKLPLTPSHQHHSLGVSVREKFSRSISARPETSFTEFDSRVSKLLESERLPVVGPPNKTLGSTVLGSKSRPLLHYDVHSTKSRRSTSVNDLRQIFENQEMSMPTRKTKVGGLNGNAVGTKSLSNHIRMSSLDSTCSESDTGTPAHYGSSTSLGSIAVDHYGSISSLTSSTSLISAQVNHC